VPVYEYRCSKGHEYEKTESFSAPAQQKCINCGARARRQISRPAVIFKGSGFYSTDNRGSRGRTDSEPAPVSTPASDNGHGHSHGDGGHSHDTPSAAKVDASVD
jgi:putative FmdB family regulatory protein